MIFQNEGGFPSARSGPRPRVAGHSARAEAGDVLGEQPGEPPGER
jgi:hypothetical protein